MRLIFYLMHNKEDYEVIYLGGYHPLYEPTEMSNEALKVFKKDY